MGRVDDALRRAAGEPVVTPPLTEADPRIFSTDQYAVEKPEAPASPVAPAVPAPVEPSPAVSAAPADTTLAPASLFERIDSALAQKVVIDHNTSPLSREQYRRLAATLHQRQADSGMKVVMIASAVASEGKTLTASNL